MASKIRFDIPDNVEDRITYGVALIGLETLVLASKISEGKLDYPISGDQLAREKELME